MSSQSPPPDPYDLPDDEAEDPILPLLRRDPSLEHDETCRRLAKLLRKEGDPKVWDGPPRPKYPTDAIPGSPEKLRMMLERTGRDEQACHPDDVYVSDRDFLSIVTPPRQEGGSCRRANGAQPTEDRRMVSQPVPEEPDEELEAEQQWHKEFWEWRRKHE